MGRGSMYQYKNFMLIDMEDYPELSQDDFVDTLVDNLGYQLSSDHDFLVHKSLEVMYKASGELDKEYDGDTWYDTYSLGIDFTGGLPCIYAVPEYDPDEYAEVHIDTAEQYLARISHYVKKDFNELIKLFPTGTFRYPTSSYTSRMLEEYPL